MNPGDIKKAEQLGYKGQNSYVWHSCTLCGRGRWTELRKSEPRYILCPSCARITHFKKKRLLAESSINLGEIKTASELGYRGHNSYTQHSCVICGRRRWTEIRKSRPRHVICSSCLRKAHYKEKRLEIYGHVCPPHYWLIDQENVGKCKYCGQVKDFGELHRKLIFRLGSQRNEPVGAEKACTALN